MRTKPKQSAVGGDRFPSIVFDICSLSLSLPRWRHRVDTQSHLKNKLVRQNIVISLCPCKHHNKLHHKKRTKKQLTTITFLLRNAHFVAFCPVVFNPLIATLKPQTNGPSYSNTVSGTLAVDGFPVKFGTAMRGLGWAAARPCPSSLYQM